MEIVNLTKKQLITSNSIRKSWIDIFLSYGYTFSAPSSLIPEEGDNSLLFVNSGVSTMKKFFSNPKLLISRNLVNCQPVIRTSDIDQINLNSFHQTTFEMLGCFSVGGNFKKEVIPIIWEWFVSENWLNICATRLFITIWEGDKDSYDIWKSLAVSEQNIILGDKSNNFWDMGDGPCGPNTELFFSLNESDSVTPNKVSDLNNKNFIELGNIVFPDLYHSNNEYKTLSEKCVDIGVGLERVAMIKQGKKSTFDIDIWEPIISKIKEFL